MKTNLLRVRRVQVRALAQLQFSFRFPSLFGLVVLCFEPPPLPVSSFEAHPMLKGGNLFLIHVM